MAKKLIILLTIFTLFINGYQFSGGDQSTYVPMVLRQINPQLFEHDYLTQAQEANLSLMFPLLASIIKLTHINLEWLYFILFITCLYFTLLAFYHLSLKLTCSPKISLLAATLLSLPKYVGATNNQTLDTALVPRSLIFPLFLFTFINIIDKRFTISAFLIGLIFLIHPYSAIYLAAFLFIFILFQKQPLNKLFKAAIAGLIPTLPFVLAKASPLTSTSPKFMIGDWYQIVFFRMPYLFITNWNINGWISLFIPLCFIYIYLKTYPKTQFSTALKLSLLTATMVSLVHILFGEIIRLSLVIQLQLLRIWLIPVILGYIASAYYIYTARRKWLAAFIFLALFTNFTKQKINAIEWPNTASTEAIQVQKWLQLNTPQDAIIITPTLRAGFRIHSQRAITTSYKDGSSGLYSQSFALQWLQRQNDLHNISSKTQTEIKNLQQKYNADFLVTFKPSGYPAFTKIFETDIFIVYKL